MRLPIPRRLRLFPRALSVSFYIPLLILSFVLCSAVPASAATSGAEVKMACKNKCQYSLEKNCYETCIKDSMNQGQQDDGSDKKEKKLTWEEMITLAEEYYGHEDYEQASTVYEQLITIDPLAYNAHYNLGVCYERMGMNEQAISEYQKYLDIKPYAEDRPEVEAWIRRLNSQPNEERLRYQTYTIAAAPTGKVKLRIIQNTDVRLRVDIISPEPFNYKIVERENPASVSLRAYLNGGYTPTREVIPVWRGGIKEILLHWEEDEEDPARRSYLLVTVRLDKKPRSSEPFSGFTDGYVSYDAIDDQIYTFDMAEDERQFSFVFDIHLTHDTTFLEKVDIQQTPLRDICQVISKYSKRSCIVDFRLYSQWELQDRAITYSAEKVFLENVLDYFSNIFHFRWVATDDFYVLLSEEGFDWLAQNSMFYNMRPGEKPDLSAKILDPVNITPSNTWDVMDYFSNWHYISFKESVVWRLKDSASGGEGIRNGGVLTGSPTLEDFLTAYSVANSLYWFNIWDAYFLTDRPDRIGRFIELAQLGDWQKKVPVAQPARLGFNDFDISKDSRYFFRWGLIYLNNKSGDWSLREFERVVNRSPESADVYYYSGIACLEQGQYTLAVKAFQRAIRLRPDFAMARFMLARTFQKFNALRASIEMFQTALSNEPEFAPASRELAILYTRSGLIKDSIKHLKKAVDVMPADMEAQYELSRAQYYNGDYEESWNHLVIARPTEYVGLTFPQIQRRLILEFGQLWHKDWYKYDSKWYNYYPKRYKDYPGWYYEKPDWKNAQPGYYKDDFDPNRAYPEMNYYPYYDENKQPGELVPSIPDRKKAPAINK